jgi:tetratricopeptide (TPR) repeat protein
MRASKLLFAVITLTACSSSLTVGCGGGSGGGARGPHGERATAADVAVTDDAFAGAVRDLLASDPGSRERAARLDGVEARQMARAAARFKAHDPERGLAAVTGGLYLLRAKELKPTTLGTSAHVALAPAVKELSTRGDEGRARALYEILSRLTIPAGSGTIDKKDVQSHLDAINAWTKETVAIGGPLQSAGALERVAVSRRLLEPSDAALDEATKSTVVWVERAIELRAAYRTKRQPPPREEATEAFRALQSGGGTLAAIYLRDADAVGALKAIDLAKARELARPELIQALEAVVDKPSAPKWIDVLHGLRPAPREGGQADDDIPEDQELLRGAAFGVALEAYRLDPTLPEAAGAVAAGLQEYGMAEASPAVLVDAARAHPEPRTIGGALAITLHAMAVEIEAQDTASARRAFKAAGPLLALADAPGVVAKVQPSAAHVRAMMGEIELREGNVPEARDLLKSAATTEKTGNVLSTLARIERFEGQSPAAIGHLKAALVAPDVAKDPTLHAEILLTLSDVLRESGDAAGARQPLVDALKELARARTAGDGDDHARAERVLARVLDRFGAVGPGSKALERAFDAAPHDKNQASATLGIIVARGVVNNDLKAARDGLKRAIAADLTDDDLIYIALWTRIVEKQTKATPDGNAEHVFSQVLDDGRWIGRLAAFGSGRIKGEDLIASAKNPAQKTEALFYAAMDRRAAGDVKGAEADLKKVLTTGGIDLMEVSIARDLLAGPRATVGGPVPEVGLP